MLKKGKGKMINIPLTKPNSNILQNLIVYEKTPLQKIEGQFFSLCLNNYDLSKLEYNNITTNTI